MLDNNLIKKVITGECSRIEKNSFIESCVKISRNYLSLKYYKFSKQIPQTELELEDIAIEAIALLFLTNESNELFNLKRAYESWEPPIQSETDVLYFLNKIIQNRVEQHIVSILKNSDPQFTQIFNALNYQIRKNNYEKQSIFVTVYIVKKVLQKFEKPLINHEEFEQLEFRDFRKDKNLLQNIFSYLEKSKKYTLAIPLNLLIYKLKSLNEGKLARDSIIDESFEKVSLNEIIEQSITTTHQKLCTTYLKKNKLSEKEVELFKAAIIDLGNDLKDGGISEGLYKYLKEHSPKLTREKYFDKYQNILEYLLKTLKSEIKIRLTEN